MCVKFVLQVLSLSVLLVKTHIASLKMHFPENIAYNWPTMAGRTPSKEAPPFGQRLAALRRERGYSQQRLAELLATTRANIAYYERSAKNPTLDFIQRCAQIFEVSAADLIGVDSPEQSRRKRGPRSAVEQRFEQVSRLPRSRQKEILKVVDALISQAS